MVSQNRPAEPDVFEAWLQRELTRQHDDILREPVPETLLRQLADLL